MLKMVFELTLLLPLVMGNVYDLFFSAYTPNTMTCLSGCADWSKPLPGATAKQQQTVNAAWLKPPSSSSTACAMPGASAGEFECDGCTVDVVTNSFAGPWCWCASPKPGHKHTQYCVPPISVPGQINLQAADEAVVVAAFVTHEASKPSPTTPPPVAQLGLKSDDPSTYKTLQGVSHYYTKLSKEEHTNYVLHFVRFAALTPATEYSYRVKSGADGAVWSSYYSFTSLNPSGPTRIGIYGDMGHSRYNCMGNLKEDCEKGLIEAIVHMGDHAYDLGNAGDRRGDAYMNAYQDTLSSCPWLPIIGNHEANDGDSYNRYLNMTYGVTMKNAVGDLSTTHSTATTVLGDFLTKTTLLAAGSHGQVPSNTSRFFSVDVGLIHVVGLDLNRLDTAQLDWLKRDLNAVDRAKTPWILVSSHFPLSHPKLAQNANASFAYYNGNEAERFATSGHDFKPAMCKGRGEERVQDNDECEREETVGEFQAKVGSQLFPIFAQFSVDIYDAGHIHDYSSYWPLCEDGNICKDANGQPIKSFVEPKGTVHITEGNGGVPGVVGKSTITDCKSPCRKHGTGGAYGRITAHNSTHLTYEHVQNNGGVVSDSFTIVQSSHLK